MGAMFETAFGKDLGVAEDITSKSELPSDFGEKEHPSELPDDSGEKQHPLELSNDAGEKRSALGLPDDSGVKRYPSELPKDTEEKAPEKKLSADEIAQKQDKIIRSVESGRTPLETNLEKGNYGEMKVDQDLREKNYERISKDSTSSLDDPPHQGIDGVYYNPDGNPPYLIVDAKYNTAQLEGNTSDGPQMSQNWIDTRLDAAVGKERADEIRMAQLKGDVGCYIAHVAKGDDLKAPVSYDRINNSGDIVDKDVKINAA